MLLNNLVWNGLRNNSPTSVNNRTPIVIGKVNHCGIIAKTGGVVGEF